MFSILLSNQVSEEIKLCEAGKCSYLRPQGRNILKTILVGTSVVWLIIIFTSENSLVETYVMIGYCEYLSTTNVMASTAGCPHTGFAKEKVTAVQDDATACVHRKILSSKHIRPAFPSKLYIYIIFVFVLFCMFCISFCSYTHCEWIYTASTM